MTLRVRADHVVAFQDGGHVLLPDGEVVIDGDVVTAVGPRTSPNPGDEVIDTGASVLLPGLIDLDALADIDHAVFDSCWGAAHSVGLDWSADWFHQRRRDVLTRAERRLVRHYAFVQLLLHGVTTAMPIAAETHSAWAETFDDGVDMARAASELGLRAYLGTSYRAGVRVRPDATGPATVAWNEELGSAGLADAVGFAEWLGALDDPLLRPVLLPCRIETLTPKLMTATAAAAARLGTKVRLHCLQGRFEWTQLAERYGRTPVQLLRETGLLGPDLLVPHAIYLNSSRYTTDLVGDDPDDDLRALADAGVAIVHCPLTSVRYGAALESFGRYRAAGVTIALGTDSFPPDLVRGMDYGVNIAKLVDGRLDAAPAGAYLTAATLGGARALGRADLGRLAVGAAADLVAFSLDDLRDGVLEDPIRTLLASGSGRSVRLSVIAGRVVVRDGVVPGVDVAALRAEAQRIFDKLLRAYSERDVLRRARPELLPPEFPAFRR
ncbi:chlorohydrolase family protein [Nocardia jiangxiensis]|uniref:Chlorohydrolase family protein n=1 Tax=Nocardia jiangxiensis TaxID=282685 RepID=A0ABW6RRJ4_9NOCA